VLPVRVNSKTSDQNVPVFAVHFLLKPVELSLSLPFWAFLGSEATCGLVECEANYLDLRHRYLGPYWPVFNVIQVEGALQPLGTQHHRQLGHRAVVIGNLRLNKGVCCLSPRQASIWF